MVKAENIRKIRLIIAVSTLFLVHSYIVFAEDVSPDTSSTPEAVPTPPPTEVTPEAVPTPPPTEPVIDTNITTPSTTPTDTSSSVPAEQQTKENFDKTFTDPVAPVDPAIPPASPDNQIIQDPNTIFSEVNIENKAPNTTNSTTDENTKKFDEIFTTTDLKTTPQIDLSLIKDEQQINKQDEEITKKPEPLQSCAFDNFSIEMNKNEKKVIPLLLKKSDPNKKFGLMVGKLPDGVKVKFTSNNDDCSMGDTGSPALEQKFSDLENKAANKELIFKDSVLEEKDPTLKSKEKDPKIDKRDMISEEISVEVSGDSQEGSFNIPIIYGESDTDISKAELAAESISTTSCQFNLIIK